jgi:acetate kinase
MKVLCVNLGSRTAKLTVLAVDDGARLGRPAPVLLNAEAEIEAMGSAEAFAAVDLAGIDVVAYRVVRVARLPERDAIPFDEEARAAIAASEELAPLHTRSVLVASDALRRFAPRAVHVAVFDAAFHRTIPDRSAAYGLPYDDFVAGWRKIGFHGLSYAYATARTAELLGDSTPRRRLVAAHLGGGCSICAIDGNHSIDTTMGFTPVDGLLMATRTGTVDPGMLLAYMREKQLSIAAVEEILSNRSGLLGVGGHSDMREIIDLRDRGDARATLAYAMFVYRAQTAIGAMTAALGGLDALVFLGGIGENAPSVRYDVCERLHFAGVELDIDRNAAPQDDAFISAEDARVAVLRIKTREDWTMALAAREVAARASA